MANRVKVLLVDDNPMVMGLLRGALTSLATVTTATDATDALLKAIDDPPDLLISDYRMPGMDGHELIRAIRKRARDKGAMTPAIALTAFAMTRDQRASSLAGFDAHVAKPLSAQTLIETICSVCEVGNAH